MKTLIMTLLVMALVGCGSSSNEPTNQDKSGYSNGCPSGSFLSNDSFNSMYVGSTGLISFNMNRCKSSGTISCNGKSFTMHIDSKDDQAIDLNQCVGLGDFSCEYDTSGGDVIIICPKGPTPNPFKSSMVFSRN